MIFKWLKKLKSTKEIKTEKEKTPQEFWEEAPFNPKSRLDILRSLNRVYFSEVEKFLRAPNGTQDASIGTMDSNYLKNAFAVSNQNIPEAVLQWYGSQSFIGFQTCAILAQNTQISKACTLPGADALRKGYKITVNNGVELDLKILDEMRQLDEYYALNYQMEKLESRCRMFGIRIVIFNIRGAGEEFYRNPFNPEGVMPNSYEGITQVDPFWVTPELDARTAGDPSYEYFMEPTWWNVQGKIYHRTHLIVIRHEEVADILKPAYLFGGLSIPQKIYESVYNATRSSNEAPMLLMTKRLTSKKIDMSAALMNQQAFENRAKFAAYYRDNYGVDLIDHEEEITQFDTTLTDVNAIMEGQYHLVAAESGIPITKFLGESPTGMGSSGNYEESSYHELLGCIKNSHFTPFLQRHYQLLLLSEICPKYGIEPFDFKIEWNKSDEPTEKEAAEVNKLKSEVDAVYVNLGALSGEEIRARVINDPLSGYNGLSEEIEVDEDFTEMENAPEENDEIG